LMDRERERERARNNGQAVRYHIKSGRRMTRRKETRGEGAKEQME
jgi:hypothetical protein